MGLLTFSHRTLREWGQERRVQLLVLPKAPRISCHPPPHPSPPFPSGQAKGFNYSAGHSGQVTLGLRSPL